MKKIYKLLIIMMLFIGSVSVLTGCDNTDTEKDQIYASFYITYDFTKKIVGDKYEVINLVPTGMEPHEYVPTTDEINGLYSCKLFIANGLDLEGYLSDLDDTILDKTVIASTGIEAYTVSKALDPHIWNSIPNAIKMLENIASAVIEMDPDNAAYYQTNLEEYTYLFNALDAKIRLDLAGLSCKTLITAHHSFGYFAKEYDLTYYSICGLSASDEPSTSDLNAIIDMIKRDNIPTIFSEELESEDNVNVIKNETQCRTASLNPIGGITDTADDYLTVMSNNLITIVKELS